MYSLIRNQKIVYVFSLLLIIIYSGIDLLKSFLISFLFAKNLLKDIQTIILIVIVYLVAYLIILTLQQYTIEVLKNKIRYDLNKNVYQAYLSKTIQSFQEKDSSEILNEFNNEINVVTDTYVSAKLNIFSLTVSFIFGSAYIIHLSLEIFIFLFLCAVLTLFINTVFKKRLKENQKNYLSSMQQWLYSLKNFCRSFRDIKILNLENTFIHELDEKNKNLEQNILQNNGFIKLISSLNSFISIAMFL